MKRSSLVLALMAAGLCGLSSQAFAQSAQDFNDLRAELKALRAELNQLKAQQAQQAPAASASAWNDRLDTVELRQKDAVVLGDIPNSFRLPGSETSIRVYGFAEAKTTYGRIGVKVWVFKGEVFDREEAEKAAMEAEAAAAEKNADKPAAAPAEGEAVMPYARNDDLARPWIKPGTPGLMHRVGGIEKHEDTGNIDYYAYAEEKARAMERGGFYNQA